MENDKKQLDLIDKLMNVGRNYQAGAIMPIYSQHYITLRDTVHDEVLDVIKEITIQRRWFNKDSFEKRLFGEIKQLLVSKNQEIVQLMETNARIKRTNGWLAFLFLGSMFIGLYFTMIL